MVGDGERPLSELLQDIVTNLQEIVRAEVRLAKTELRIEAQQATSSAAWVIVGLAAAVTSVTLLVWTSVYALAAVMSLWMATLIVAVVVAVIGGLVARAGIQKFRQIKPIPDRTIETVKENLEWIKQSTR
jgi:putative superfamily III holin-X